MATQKHIRRLAFQALYQLDARGEADANDVRASMDGDEQSNHRERAQAFELALGAMTNRTSADAELEQLAPDWPSYRLAAVDRAILRLGHYELTKTSTPHAVIINEAVELAKEFSTEKSPSFVNAILDQVFKRHAAGGGAGAAVADAPAGESGTA